MPAPSPRTKPFAAASKACAMPSGESIAACEKPMNPPGVIITVTPPASAVVTRVRPDMLTSGMDRRQRRGAGRIHGHAGPAQVQAVGNAVGRDAVRAARGRMRGDAGRVPRRSLDDLIVVVRNPDEHADVGPALKIQDKARVLNRLPCGLEQQPLLRIDIGRFARRDAEELRIKLVDLVNEAPASRDGFARDARLRVVKAFHIPPICRHFAHGFAAFDQQFPKASGFIDSAGKTASDSNDGDAIFGHDGKENAGKSRA